MKNENMSYLKEKFDNALVGRKIWLQIKEKYDITSEDGLVIFASNDKRLNTEAIRSLPSYVGKRTLKKIIAVFDEKQLQESISDIWTENICICEKKYSQILQLLQYYRLVQFFENIFVISLEEPYGNKHLIDILGITMDNYLNNSIGSGFSVEAVLNQIQKDIELNAENRLKDKSLVLYGCNFFSRKIIFELYQRKLHLSAIVDNDKRKVGSRFLGVKVLKPQEYLLPYDSNKMILICSSYEEQMIESLIEMRYSYKNIFSFYKKASSEMDYVIDAISSVKKGYKIYERLISNDKNAKLLIAPRASGDIFIACSFLKEWCEENGIENYVLIGTGRNVLDIAELFGISHVEILSQEEREYLVNAYMFLGNELNVKLISEWEMRIRNSYLPKSGEIVFVDKFRYEIFNLNRDTKAQSPYFNDVKDFNKYGLKKDKSIIIAPYAYSSPATFIPMNVWEVLVRKLKRRGYKVFTVGYGKRELPIKGSSIIQFSYKNAKSILEYSGAFIGVRSGLCDIVHAVKCKKLIIYGKNLGDDSTFDYFSLERNYSNFVGKEIVYDEYTEEEFMIKVIGYFE